MLPNDDDLEKFVVHGAALPVTSDQGYVDHDGARIWFATYGAGSPVILLHGGLDHSGNWGYQVPTVLGSGRRVILIDSRGHGRSTRDLRPFTYELMASGSIPGAELFLLPGVSHFAPLQRPAQFNSVMRAFLDKVLA
jgi:pimeloyl-ACP methyl ester carboxylesterase